MEKNIDSMEFLDEEWNFLVSEVKSEIENSKIDDKSSEILFKLSEIDCYHRVIQNEYKNASLQKKQILAQSSLYSSFFIDSPIGYIVLTDSGFVEDANEMAAKYWSIERYRMKGLGFLGLIAGEHISILTKAIESAKYSGQRKTLDIKCVRPDKKEFWGRFDLIETKNNTDRKILCSVVDITADRVLEDAVRATAVGLSSSTGVFFFKELTDFLTRYDYIDLAIISDHVGNGDFTSIAISPDVKEIEILSYNYDLASLKTEESLFEPSSKYICKIMEIVDVKDGISIFLFDSDRNISGQLAIFTKDRFLEKKLYSGVLKVVSARATAELQRYKAELGLNDYRKSLEEQIGTRTKEIKDKNKKLAREIEKRKKSEKHLLIAKSQAEEATKAKSLFLEHMSHEIRTPMNGVLGITNLMENMPLSKKMKNYVRIIRESGDRLLTIINDILDISKLESGKMELKYSSINLKNHILKICQSKIGAVKQKKLFLFASFSLNFPQKISVDSVRLGQVIENLLSNAIKFTNQGYVSIEVNYYNSRSLEIKVEDSGIGIDNDKVAKIFNRFVRVCDERKGSYQGTGLGLSITRELINLMGGSISCASEKDQGTVFLAKIPLNEPVFYNLPIDADKPSQKTNIVLALENHQMKKLILKNFILRDYQVFEHSSINLAEDSNNLILITDNLALIENEASTKRYTRKIYTNYFDTEKSQLKYKNVEILEYPVSVDDFLELLEEVQDNQVIPASNNIEEKVLESLEVLLVEDNHINQIVAADMLKSLGARVDIADDGFKAIERVESKNYDLMFLDCFMPNLDGFETLKILKSEKYKVTFPIVALTANAMKGMEEKCLELGFDSYLSKPVRIDDLKKTRDILKF